MSLVKFTGSYTGDDPRNGKGIMVKEDLVEEVFEVKRLDDRMMKIAMVSGRKIAVFYLSTIWKSTIINKISR